MHTKQLRTNIHHIFSPFFRFFSWKYNYIFDVPKHSFFVFVFFLFLTLAQISRGKWRNEQHTSHKLLLSKTKRLSGRASARARLLQLWALRAKPCVFVLPQFSIPAPFHSHFPLKSTTIYTVFLFSFAIILLLSPRPNRRASSVCSINHSWKKRKRRFSSAHQNWKQTIIRVGPFHFLYAFVFFRVSTSILLRNDSMQSALHLSPICLFPTPHGWHGVVWCGLVGVGIGYWHRSEKHWQWKNN